MLSKTLPGNRMHFIDHPLQPTNIYWENTLSYTLGLQRSKWHFSWPWGATVQIKAVMRLLQKFGDALGGDRKDREAGGQGGFTEETALQQGLRKQHVRVQDTNSQVSLPRQESDCSNWNLISPWTTCVILICDQASVSPSVKWDNYISCTTRVMMKVK